MMPPSGGSNAEGPRSDPVNPPWAVHELKPPALPGDTYFNDAIAPLSGSLCKGKSESHNRYWQRRNIPEAVIGG